MKNNNNEGIVCIHLPGINNAAFGKRKHNYPFLQWKLIYDDKKYQLKTSQGSLILVEQGKDN